MEKIINILLNEQLIETLLLWQAILVPCVALMLGLIWGSLKNRWLMYPNRAARPSSTAAMLKIVMLRPCKILLYNN